VRHELELDVAEPAAVEPELRRRSRPHRVRGEHELVSELACDQQRLARARHRREAAAHALHVVCHERVDQVLDRVAARAGAPAELVDQNVVVGARGHVLSDAGGGRRVCARELDRAEQRPEAARAEAEHGDGEPAPGDAHERAVEVEQEHARAHRRRAERAQVVQCAHA
jgi:hypothetical protein